MWSHHSAQEAYAIVLFGRAAELVNKFDTNIDGWTCADHVS
jgi:hypothetical protein